MENQSLCPPKEILERFVLGHLSPVEVEQWAGHVEQCGHCITALDGFRAEDTVMEAMKKPGGVEQQDQHVRASMVQREDKSPNNDGTLSSERPTLLSSEKLPQIPGYEILGVLGRGGMGVVYQAWHVALRRPVALKMVRAGEQASAEELARFEAEAQAVARLRHANIVQIYEVGKHQGRPFFSLEYIAGGTLAQRLNKSPQPVRACAQVVELLARAVHHAHTLGIVHRDLKPANVLLQLPEEYQATRSSAETVSESCDLQTAIPKITDFGLAKHLEEDAGHTQTGAVMGTPAYMAPEQASGRSKDAGPAVDVYALGVILYEMLTGRPPFTGDSTLDILEQVRSRDPDRPGKLQPKIHRDLETICLKALAKEPERRYESALALAEDLARFNAGEPIKARPEGVARRWWRRVRRHQVAASIALALSVALLVTGVWLWNWTSANREISDLERKIEAAMDAPEWNDTYVARINADLAALEELDPDKATEARTRFGKRYARFQEIQLGRRIDAALDAPELTHVYWQRVQADLGALQNLDADLAEAARQRFQKRFARFLEDHIRKPTLLAHDIKDLGSSIRKLAAVAPTVAQLLGDVLERRVAGWDPSFKLAANAPDKLFEPGQVAMHKDVVMPVVAAADRSDVIATNQIATNHDELSAVFDERWDETARLGIVLNSLRQHELEINALAFSPDGSALASASGYRPIDGMHKRWIGTVKVWELNGKERFTYRPEKVGAISLAYFPDNKALAVACEGEAIVRLLDPRTGTVLHQWAAHEGAGIGALAVSRDGLTLATGSGIPRKSGEVRLWDTKTWKMRQSFVGFRDIVTRLALSADGRLVAAAGRDRAVKVWDIASRQEKLSGLPFFHESADNSLIFTSDSKTLIAPFNLQEVPNAVIGPLLLWDTASGKRKQMAIGMPTSAISALALSANDRTLAIASAWDGRLVLFDLEGGKRREFQHLVVPNHFTSVAISRDGNYLATGTTEGVIQVRQVNTGQLHVAFESQGYAFTVQTRNSDVPGPPLESFKKMRTDNGSVTLTLSRNGDVLREQKVLASELPPGPLQLMARRDGHRLFFQVNTLPPLEFEESQPLPAQGALALIWPKGIGLQALEAMRRRVPEGATALERGDELMANSKYAEALASYRAQIVAAGTGDKDVSQQARLKAALCLVKLQRLSDAIPELERLAGESKSRWSAIASCELLQLYLNQGRTKDVDVLFDVLSENHSFEKIIPLMAKESRERLLRFYTEEVMETHLLYRPRAADVRNLDRSTRVHDYFQIPKAGRLPLRRAYLRGYHFDGKLDQALQVAEELLIDDGYWVNGRSARDVIPVVERVAWILRQKGQAQEALTRVNQYLVKDISAAKDYKPLLLERARIHVALKQWDQAEKDIDEVLRLPSRELGYLRYANACLAQGFLRHRRGDAAGALKSWRAGLYTAYAPATAISEVEALQTLPVIDVLRGVTLAALADALTPADADVLLEHLSTRRGRSVAGDNPIPIRLPVPPGILRDMWRTPRGMDCARKIAFQEASYAETLRMPLILLGAENAHQAAMPRDLTPEHEAVLWQACEKAYMAYMEEKLDPTQVIALGFAWKGTIGFLGWGGVAPSLDSSVRGPLAYVLGQRYLTRLKMPAEALTLFETALRDAPPNSALKRLAQAEVDRLKKAK